MMLFVAPTVVGKMHIANHFGYVVILCTTLQYNGTYRSPKWCWTDPDKILIELSNRLNNWIEKLSNILSGFQTLFLINDIIANETLNKRRQLLLE